MLLKLKFGFSPILIFLDSPVSGNSASTRSSGDSYSSSSSTRQLLNPSATTVAQTDTLYPQMSKLDMDEVTKSTKETVVNV